MSDPHDFLVTPEELRLRQQKRRRLLFAGASLVIVLALVLVLGRPAAHAIKRWQARRHAGQALALIASEKWSEAQKEATAAYQLAPNEPEAIRAVARFLSRVRQPQALEFWDKLAAQVTLGRDDLRDEASIALALGETNRAAKAIGRLTAKGDRESTPGDWLLEAQLDAQRGAPHEGITALRKVLADSGASSREQLQAAVMELRLAAANPEREETPGEAWQRVEQLAKGEDAAGLEALVLLAQRELAGNAEKLKPDPLKSSPIPPLTNNQKQITASASTLSQALARHPLAKTSHQLLAIDLRIHASPDQKAALIQAAIDRWQNGDNESLVALATWLNGKGEYQQVLVTIPLQRANQNKDLYLQRLDALGALGRWEEIKQALNSESYPLDSVIARMYLARCNAQLGEVTASENNWQRALEAAASDVLKLMTLADYAQKNGAAAIASQAYDAAIGASPNLRAAWQGKLNLDQASRDTMAIHSVLAEMLKIWPKDAAIQNDEAYLRLLLLTEQKPEVESEKSKVEGEDGGATGAPGGTVRLRRMSSKSSSHSSQLSAVSPPHADQLSEIEALAVDLVRREPASLPHRTLLALVYLKENRPATALGVYEKLNVPPHALTPSALAVHAAVLQANGNAADAAKEASQVPRNSLLPEERVLIEKLTPEN